MDANHQTDAVSREEFAEMRADLRHLLQRVDEFVTKLEPLLFARSGEVLKLRAGIALVVSAALRPDLFVLQQ